MESGNEWAEAGLKRGANCDGEIVNESGSERREAAKLLREGIRK